jgi:DNA repair protein RecO (recombination protein O)
MLNTTRAIVLHKINYSESSLVVQAFSFHYGKISLLVQGVRKGKSRTKIALFEPLSIIEFVGNFKNTDALIKPRDLRLHYPLIQIQTDISKRMIGMFLSEILYKCVKEPNPEKDMYVFIENALKFLDLSNEKVANFHLVFLFQLSRFLGFYPRMSNGKYFNMLEGNFTDSLPLGNTYLQGENKDLFKLVLGMNFDTMNDFKLTSEHRKIVLHAIIEYYDNHIQNLGEVKSHQILESIFK